MTPTAGKWNVAPLPGGATNWGGSWLGVPTAAKHKDAAIALAEWLSASRQQVDDVDQGRTLPVELDGRQDPPSRAPNSAYFSNAPVGQIFGDSPAR